MGSFTQMRGRLGMLMGFYKSLVCKYNALVVIIGNPIPSYPTPSQAQADAGLAIGSLYYTDGTAGGFPPGQPWVKV